MGSKLTRLKKSLNNTRIELRRRFLSVFIIFLTVVIVLIIAASIAMPDGSKIVLERLDKEGVSHSQFQIAYQDSLLLSGVSLGNKENQTMSS